MGYPLCRSKPYSGYTWCRWHITTSLATFATIDAAATLSLRESPLTRATPGQLSVGRSRPSTMARSGETASCDIALDMARSVATLMLISSISSGQAAPRLTSAQASRIRERAASRLGADTSSSRSRLVGGLQDASRPQRQPRGQPTAPALPHLLRRGFGIPTSSGNRRTHPTRSDQSWQFQRHPAELSRPEIPDDEARASLGVSLSTGLEAPALQ